MKNVRQSGCILVVVVLSFLTCCEIHSYAQSNAANTRVVHVLVALADNQYQGIVPVPAAIGNGDDAGRNLYWGAAYGIKNYFSKSSEWKLSECLAQPYPIVERCVFRHRTLAIVLVADAYRGREIRRTLEDFFAFSAAKMPKDVLLSDGSKTPAGGNAELIAYLGHDGLMDFSLTHYDSPVTGKQRQVIVLACASKQYFAKGLRITGAAPLLWTTGLMAPEAYILEAALAGWARNEGSEQIRERAAQAYDKYQHCGIKAARRLFATGW